MGGTPTFTGDIPAALALYRRCGATLDIVSKGRTRHRLKRRGGNQNFPRANEKIADLSADGRTNLEIAGVLSISPKTVEKHFSYGKLQCQRDGKADRAKRNGNVGIDRKNEVVGDALSQSRRQDLDDPEERGDRRNFSLG